MTISNNNQQIVPIHFRRAPAVRMAIQLGQIRRNGNTPLLRKSVPAVIAARAAQHAIALNATHTNGAHGHNGRNGKHGTHA